MIAINKKSPMQQAVIPHLTWPHAPLSLASIQQPLVCFDMSMDLT
jgi:hypothetical protein